MSLWVPKPRKLLTPRPRVCRRCGRPRRAPPPLERLQDRGRRFNFAAPAFICCGCCTEQIAYPVSDTSTHASLSFTGGSTAWEVADDWPSDDASSYFSFNILAAGSDVVVMAECNLGSFTDNGNAPKARGSAYWEHVSGDTNAAFSMQIKFSGYNAVEILNQDSAEATWIHTEATATGAGPLGTTITFQLARNSTIGSTTEIIHVRWSSGNMQQPCP